jgi:hypothetical protein
MFNDDINNIKRNWFIAIGGFIGLVYIAFVICGLLEALNIKDLPLKDKYGYETEAFKNIALILAGLVGYINIFFAAKRADAMEKSAIAANASAEAANKSAEAANKNAEAALDKQITERFSKAIEQLGSDKIEVRLGAIYTLERIAKDSKKDQWTIMEVLTAFVRENAPVNIDKGKITTDIQAAITVIGRRNCDNDEENQLLDLSNISIRQADLEDAKLQYANLEGANLEGANLTSANLESANLEGANLTSANLPAANLQGAYLFRAVLKHAKLQYANLQVANLKDANLQDADLKGANLKDAHFKGATMPNGSIHD